MVNRLSGCMSVAGYGNGFHFRLMVRVRGSRRGKMFRARGLDGSPRNAMMFQTGVRQDAQIMKNSLCLSLSQSLCHKSKPIRIPPGPPKGGSLMTTVASQKLKASWSIFKSQGIFDAIANYCLFPIAYSLKNVSLPP